jgi:penicillin-binding protein 1C
MLTDILSDHAARMSAFGDQNVLELDFDVAAKTGTSKGYRDNVAVGYTRDVTVAVWAGNFDGSPMADVSGITGAGPIFHDVMEAAARGRPSTRSGALSLREDAARLGFARSAICALSGEIATGACPHRVHEWLSEGSAEHAPPCAVHERVRVDVRNGLRAGPGCARAVTEERVLERWGPPYEEWARRTGRAVAPEESSPECPGAADDAERPSDPAAPRIAYPFDGSRFVVDPERPRALQRLDVRVEPDGAGVEVRVDGALLDKTRAWPLEVGEHTITARRGSAVSAAVRITVR